MFPLYMFATLNYTVFSVVWIYSVQFTKFDRWSRADVECNLDGYKKFYSDAKSIKKKGTECLSMFGSVFTASMLLRALHEAGEDHWDSAPLHLVCTFVMCSIARLPMYDIVFVLLCGIRLQLTFRFEWEFEKFLFDSKVWHTFHVQNLQCDYYSVTLTLCVVHSAMV